MILECDRYSVMCMETDCCEFLVSLYVMSKCQACNTTLILRRYLGIVLA